jgi:sarcosine oxidase subunit delta
MIRIDCPFCGERDHSEFAYGGDASVEYPDLDAPVEVWLEAVFQRDNIDGVQFETWQHLQSCRMWIVVERDTTTHEIHSVRPAHDGITGALAGEKNDRGGAG